ncbi:MAG: hypothetical protein OEM96_05095 [Gemmatimonadota bacterium]|nr:hypothetical protein [Gemmatimonadota bacterium]
MNQRLVWILTVSVLAACGGARQAPAPIYDLRATPVPLEYAAEVRSLTVVETPGGEQEIASTTTIVMTIAYGAPTSDGLPIEVVFSEFSTEGPAPDLSAMLGLPFRGIVGEGGEIELTETPDLDVPGFDAASLLQVINPLVIPLPPSGHPTEEAWPLQRSRDPGGGLTGESTFEGSARFAADTVWNGIPTRWLVASGDVKTRASGSPAGAPGEVDLDSEGESEISYAWDAARGVVLHVAVEIELDGTVSTQGMVLPLTIETSATYDLVE